MSEQYPTPTTMRQILGLIDNEASDRNGDPYLRLGRIESFAEAGIRLLDEVAEHAEAAERSETP